MLTAVELRIISRIRQQVSSRALMQSLNALGGSRFSREKLTD